EKATVPRRAARSVGELDFSSRHLHAALAEWNNQPRGAGIVAHGLPVVAAFGAGARRSPFADFLLQNVGTGGELAGLRIDGEDVLEDGFLGADKFPGLAIELPEDAGLANSEHRLAVADVHQDALVHFVHIERLAGRVLVVPHKL